VPEVDPEDIKAVARIYEEWAKNSGEHFAVDIEVLRPVCKPGAELRAVCYRYMHLTVLPMIACEVAEFQDTVFKNVELTDSAYDAAAKVPMKWAIRGSFDFDEFLRLCA
jgi:hypothetical protein